VIAGALALFYEILQFNIPGLWKFLLVAVEMLAVSQFLIRRYKLSSELGLVLVKSRKGIELIDRAARFEWLFNFMADAGSTISYGVLGIALMRKNTSLWSFLAGILALAVLVFFVAPTALVFLFQVMRIGATDKAVTSVPESAGLGAAIVIGMLLAGGLFLFILFGIIYYGAVVFNAVVKTLFFGSDVLSRTTPGGTILLPGVNLPLFEGILALAVVLVVHEGCHAILARIAKVPILSSGVVLFGIIPVGAFVEPDEKKLARVERGRQTRVLVAGPTANLLASLMFFAFFFTMFFTTQGFRENGYLVYSGMPADTIIYKIDGNPVDLANYTNLSLPKSSEVTLLTNSGEITRATDAQGRLGITYTVLTNNSLVARFKVPALDFLYVFLGLALALNFVVGVVNILPIPLFDGYRIVDVNVKNKTIVKMLSYTTLLFFVLNFLPLLFH
jgi:membrane-associated protease RseP (regulator of RpoE activity)